MRRTSRKIMLDRNTSQSFSSCKRCFQIVTIDKNRFTELRQAGEMVFLTPDRREAALNFPQLIRTTFVQRFTSSSQEIFQLGDHPRKLQSNRFTSVRRATIKAPTIDPEEFALNLEAESPNPVLLFLALLTARSLQGITLSLAGLSVSDR
jgi:hypothetical protein